MRTSSQPLSCRPSLPSLGCPAHASAPLSSHPGRLTSSCSSVRPSSLLHPIVDRICPRLTPLRNISSSLRHRGPGGSLALCRLSLLPCSASGAGPSLDVPRRSDVWPELTHALPNSRSSGPGGSSSRIGSCRSPSRRTRHATLRRTSSRTSSRRCASRRLWPTFKTTA
jgi:hypothetical protein